MALYGITNANQMIDVAAIKSACDQIDAAVEDFITAANKIEEAKSYAGGDALRVEGQTMEDSYEQIKMSLEDTKQKINDFTISVVNAANSIYYSQSEELAAYNAEQAKN